MDDTLQSLEREGERQHANAEFPAFKHFFNGSAVQTPDFYTVTGNLPGVIEEDIVVAIEGDVLSLSVENQDTEKNKEEV